MAAKLHKAQLSVIWQVTWTVQGSLQFGSSSEEYKVRCRFTLKVHCNKKLLWGFACLDTFTHTLVTPLLQQQCES